MSGARPLSPSSTRTPPLQAGSLTLALALALTLSLTLALTLALALALTLALGLALTLALTLTISLTFRRRLEWDGGIEDPRVVERAPADGGGFLMTYTAWNKMVARLCIATSPNLLAWSRHGPAFAGTAYEDAWSKSGAIVARAAADGRVIAERVQGRFWMYWGEHHVHLATSPDLIRWTPLLDAAAPVGEGYRSAEC